MFLCYEVGPNRFLGHVRDFGHEISLLVRFLWKCAEGIAHSEAEQNEEQEGFIEGNLRVYKDAMFTSVPECDHGTSSTGEAEKVAPRRRGVNSWRAHLDTLLHWRISDIQQVPSLIR